MKHVWVWIVLLWGSASAADTLTVNAFNFNATAPILSELKTLKVDNTNQKVATADLHLLIQNQGDVPKSVSIEFAAGSGTAALMPELENHRCTKTWGFWTTPSIPVVLPDKAIQDVRVTFCALWNAKLGPLTGQLQARTATPLPSRSLYTQTLTISPPDPPVLSKEDKDGFEQSDLVITALRFNPFRNLTTGTQAVGWHGTTPLVRILSPEKISHFYDLAGSRAVMAIALDPNHKDQALLTIKDLHAGTYKGSWVLRPGDENSPVLTITANVKHFWLWPLLVLLATCALLFFGLRWREFDRPKKVLKLQMANAARQYKQDKQKASNLLNVSPLSFIYDTDTDDKNNLSKIQLLSKQVDDANRLDTLNSVGTEIAVFESLLLRWLPLHQRQAQLRAQQAQVSSVLTNTPELITNGAGHLQAPETLYPLLLDIRFDTNKRLYKADVDAFEDGLSRRSMALHIFSEALTAYALLTSSGLNHRPAISILNEFVTEDPVILQGLLAQIRTLLFTSPPVPHVLAGVVANPVVPVPILAPFITTAFNPAALNVEQLQRLIDGRDRWVFLALLIVALTAIFIAQYNGKNFGTAFDYLTLITSGVTGIALFKGLDLLPVWQLKG